MCRRSGVVLAALLLLGLPSCGDDDPLGPPEGNAIAGLYDLVSCGTTNAMNVPILPRIQTVIDECGNGPDAPNATFTFSDSSSLVLQEEPQTYSMTLIGTVTDCDANADRFFDIVSADYVLVDDSWITLQGDLHHPHFAGTVLQTDSTGSMEVAVRPAQPGLEYPVQFVGVLTFQKPPADHAPAALVQTERGL